ncbi:hypothetical protein A3Q56_08058 [Intoshia linei]|uniref:Uncharacterized protein n=1 Tax=Intoshia linei TaxID=1819745 RepID=A0A177AQI3_9BILA|nr:hypothetical protein A3Q56_08058 [Intoshia linei]
MYDGLTVVDISSATYREWMEYLTKRGECERRRAHQMGHPLHWYMNNGFYYTP